MIIKRLRHILPPLTLSEMLELSSTAALERGETRITPRRPFRSPHHTATPASIFGGGSSQAKIGEVALAHGGILFFDELPHFGKTILEALREPLEDHRLLISRVNTKTEYPARFLFAGAMNPCPCGNLLSANRVCRCNELEIQRYQARLSDPFLDRIDLYVEMTEAGQEEKSSESSAVMAEKVRKAFLFRQKRQQKEFNAHLDDASMERYCPLDREGEELIDQATVKFGLSERGRARVLRVARTIADLEESGTIGRSHLLEALSYRRR